jgi:hypothetical protein
MDHGWDWSADDDGSGGDADTADLGGDNLGGDLGDLAGHDFGDLGDHDLGGHDLSGHDLSGHDLGGHDLSGHDLGGHDLDEPLGTENAAANFDASLAHDGEFHEPGDHDGSGDHDDSGEPHEPGAVPDIDHDGGAGHEGDPADGHDDAGPTDGHDDGVPDAADQHSDPLLGTDPDLDHTADDPGWHDDNPFPPELAIADPPAPVDGFPWSDPSVLGADQSGTDDYRHVLDSSLHGDGAPDAADLARYEAMDVPAGTDAWTALLGSDDPATSALAQWWAPGT